MGGASRTHSHWRLGRRGIPSGIPSRPGGWSLQQSANGTAPSHARIRLTSGAQLVFGNACRLSDISTLRPCLAPCCISFYFDHKWTVPHGLCRTGIASGPRSCPPVGRVSSGEQGSLTSLPCPVFLSATFFPECACAFSGFRGRTGRLISDLCQTGSAPRCNCGSLSVRTSGWADRQT